MDNYPDDIGNYNWNPQSPMYDGDDEQEEEQEE